MKAVLLILVGVLASVGLGYVLAAFQRWMLRPHGPRPVAVVIPVTGGQEEIELTLRSAKVRLLPDTPGSPIIIADFGADAATLQICRMFCGGCPGARICRGEDLPAVLHAYAQSR